MASIPIYVCLAFFHSSSSHSLSLLLVTAPFNVTYETNLVNNNSLTITDFATLSTNVCCFSSIYLIFSFFVSSQYMKALNLKGITIFSAQLVPQSLTSASRKRRATKYAQKVFSWSLLFFHCSTTNTECGTNSDTADDLFSIAFFIKYPPACLGSAKCKKKFNETVELTIATLHNTLTLAIPITDGSILDAQLTFCSFNHFQSGK